MAWEYLDTKNGKDHYQSTETGEFMIVPDSITIEQPGSPSLIFTACNNELIVIAPVEMAALLAPAVSELAQRLTIKSLLTEEEYRTAKAIAKGHEELDDEPDLFRKLFGFVDMPYGTAKARSDDPYEFINNWLKTHLA